MGTGAAFPAPGTGFGMPTVESSSKAQIRHPELQTDYHKGFRESYVSDLEMALLFPD